MHLQDFPLGLIPLFPLIGSAYCAFLGLRMQRKYGEAAVHVPAIIFPALSTIVAVAGFFTLAGAGHGTALYDRLWSWFDIGHLQGDFAFIMDRLSAVMCLVVTVVGTLIHVYSSGYMKGDKSYWRFFSHLNLFMCAMLILVLGDNFLMMFVGWEGVGLCSYLLIAFWYTDKAKAAAGMKAFLVNRIGDFGFSLGVFMIFWGLLAAPAATVSGRISGTPADHGSAPALQAGHETADPAMAGHEGAGHGAEAHVTEGEALPGHLEAAPPADARGAGAAAHGGSNLAAQDHGQAAPGVTKPTSIAFRDVEAIVQDPVRREGLLSQKALGIGLVTLACLLLFLGASGKSAQIPLYVWLPDAMAGPTPVSALIHAATMVTAGVYMVARLHFLFALSPAAMTVVATVGAVTGLFAATIGLFQHDIKKVLAYSTVSQLGFMFLAVGVGAYWVGIFHLMTHAFFKACLFLGSGSVILGCHHEQDMRRMGGLRKLMPTTAVTYFLSCAAIAGFPFFSGFFSKDEILWKAFDSGNMLLPGGGAILWAIAAVAALCTSFYMFRSYYMTFSGEYRGLAHATAGHGHDSGGAHAAGSGHDSHGHHGGVPHESPRNITYVLVTLAFLAVVGGYVGLPHLWGLPNFFEHWLEPVFASSHHWIHSAGRSHGMEWVLMILSVGIAFGGFFLARALYKDGRSQVPARVLANPNGFVRGFYKTVYNKYYVDEAYGAVFVKNTIRLAHALFAFDRRAIDALVNLVGLAGRAFGKLQGFIDYRLVDGLVNLVARVIGAAASSIRRIQTGQIQSYIFGLSASAVAFVIVVYLLKW